MKISEVLLFRVQLQIHEERAITEQTNGDSKKKE
ncbi:hypothetical protein DNTS_032542, partial [Danionella cerebrum]